MTREEYLAQPEDVQFLIREIIGTRRRFKQLRRQGRPSSELAEVRSELFKLKNLLLDRKTQAPSKDNRP